jgi:phosphohistidine phosphatase
MKLYFVRHGIAAPKEVLQADEERSLTPERRAKTRRVAKSLHNLEITPDLILTSPLARARQTAEILREELGIKKDLKVSDSLKPGHSWAGLVHEIKSCGHLKELIVVGHQPSMGETISELLSGEKSLKIQLKKAGVCCVEVRGNFSSKSTTLLWLVTPKILKKT